LAAWPKISNVFNHSTTGIMGSNPTRGMDVCVYSVFVLPCVGSGLRRANHLSKEFYCLYIRFITSGLIPNGDRPEEQEDYDDGEEEEEEEEEHEIEIN
jgi:hypothetical protein